MNLKTVATLEDAELRRLIAEHFEKKVRHHGYESRVKHEEIVFDWEEEDEKTIISAFAEVVHVRKPKGAAAQ